MPSSKWSTEASALFAKAARLAEGAAHGEVIGSGHTFPPAFYRWRTDLQKAGATASDLFLLYAVEIEFHKLRYVSAGRRERILNLDCLLRKLDTQLERSFSPPTVRFIDTTGVEPDQDTQARRLRRWENRDKPNILTREPVGSPTVRYPPKGR